MRRIPIVFTFGLLTGLFAAGYGVLFTVLDDLHDSYGISKTALGLVVATGFFSSFLSQLVIAPMADRGHARRLVFVGMLFNVAGLVAMAVSKDVAALLLSRFIMGIGAGMAIPAARRIVILAEPDKLGHNVGRLFAADVTGFAIGPAISAVLVGPFGIAAPFLVIAIATVACLPVIVRVHVAESADTARTRLALDLLKIRPYAAAVIMGAALYMMIGTFDALWVLVLDDLDASDWVANVGITIFALPLIFLGPTGGRLAQRVGPFRLGTAGLLFGAVCMFLYGYMPTGGAMLTVGICQAIGDGFTFSSCGVAAALSAPAERQAGAQGLLGGFQVLSGGFTAMAAGFIYDEFGRVSAYTACAVTMVVLSAVSLLVAGWEGRRLMGSPEPSFAAQ
jgi:MFS family permease